MTPKEKKKMNNFSLLKSTDITSNCASNSFLLGYDRWSLGILTQLLDLVEDWQTEDGCVHPVSDQPAVFPVELVRKLGNLS